MEQHSLGHNQISFDGANFDVSNLDAAMGRRGFMGLAGIAALASMIPAHAMARLAEKYPSIRAGIDALVASGKYPNVFVAIGRGMKAPDILINAGTADKRTLDMDTLWRVYSMTKPITGMAAMMLVGDGKIKLDQPIADFLPEFQNMQVLKDAVNSMDSVPTKTQITLRHLLTHTAGFGYTIVTKGPLKKAYLDNGITPAVISKMRIPGLEVGAPTPDIATFSKRLAALPLIAEPGTKWSYSVSMDLLGHLIGVISGMEFDTFLKQRMFGPLGMNSTFFQVPKSEAARLVTNFGALGTTLLPIDPGPGSIYLDKPAFAFGGSGLVTSTRDYDQFLKMLLGDGRHNGKRIMSAKMVALGTSNLLPAGVQYQGGAAGYGAGGRAGLGDNAGEYGWGGAAGTVGAVQRRLKFRGIGMTQVMSPDNEGLQRGLAKWVVKDIMAK
jgi:CubicO group peptidase (beta-lactamase class C family)